MKRLFAFLLALHAITASATTLVPVQLLNPAGSSSGQAIVSTGSSSAPGWSTLGLSGLSAISANSLVGNATGSSATPTAVAVTGCNGAAQALQWTNGSGFGCNSSVATSGANSNITSLSGLSTPLSVAQGGTGATTSTGSGSVVLATSPTITTPNTQGVTNGAAAVAGQIGQLLVATGSSVSLTNSTAANCASINLTAGDWDVWGNITFATGASTTFTLVISGFNTTSATLPGAPNYSQASNAGAANFGQSSMPPMQTYNVSSSTTVYLVGEAGFASGSGTMSCFIDARRVH